MKRVALITLWSMPNYGSAFQAYATQVILERCGYKCDVVYYVYPNEYHYKIKWNKPSRIMMLKSWISKTFRLSPVGKIRNSLEKFNSGELNLTRKFYSYEELCHFDWSQYDAVIVGSDQVWNYKYVLGDKAFLLGFVPDCVQKLSIASSFGNSEIPETYFSLYKKYLSRFDAISVREHGGIGILKELNISKNNAVLLDPTLLLTPDDYLPIHENYQDKYAGERYILLYGQYYAFEPRPYIFEVCRYMAKKYDAIIIALEGMPSREYAKAYPEIIDKCGVSVNEFFQLFKNAFAVVTSSFHGTAFAVNYGKPLVSIIPGNGDDRQSSLLKDLGIESCAITVQTEFGKIDPFYDAGRVNGILRGLADKYIKWICESIK